MLTIFKVHFLIQARILQEFQKPSSTIRCIVCTVAFGMGINIPDVALVIHWGEPSSVVAYVQEVGRAGRNGQKADAIMFHNGNTLGKAHKDMKAMVNNIKNGK